jgi:hypothetical protein
MSAIQITILIGAAVAVAFACAGAFITRFHEDGSPPDIEEARLGRFLMVCAAVIAVMTVLALRVLLFS